MENNSKPTLTSILESSKTELAEKLRPLRMPADSAKAQKIISQFMAKLLDSDSDYRGELTNSEDLILQAAVDMLNSQQQLITAFAPKPAPKPTPAPPSPASMSAKFATPKAGTSASTSTASQGIKAPGLLGAGVGAGLGSLVLGTWGAIFGAIASTALVMYVVTMPADKRAPSAARPMGAAQPQKASVMVKTPAGTPIDTDRLLKIIGNICASVDRLIEVYRNILNQIKDKYENRPAPTLEGEFRFLLDAIQSLVGYQHTHTPEEEKYQQRLNTRIDDMVESLDNYNITVQDYDGENTHLFDVISGQKVEETRMVLPAFVKNGMPVLRGKLFTK